MTRLRLFRSQDPSESTFVGDLLRSETVGGATALIAAVLAVIWANAQPDSYHWLQTLEIGPLDLEHWAADGGLALFFFVAGLELKREFLVGSLRRPADAAVPVTAAACGVAIPALIFTVLNLGTQDARGWAIPAATDIAFAVAVLAVVGPALPSQLRAFLLTLAVVDDLIVIAIIAIVYTESVSWWWLLAGLCFAGGYAGLQQLRWRSPLAYLPVAALTWWCIHESGVHATVAGLLLGVLTRVLPDEGEERSPAERLEHRLVPVSAGLAVPLFALTSAGVTVAVDHRVITDPMFWGVLLGLLIGKPVGVLGGTWAITRFTRASLDDAVGWRDLFGVAVLAGIGFTVALLVSDLSFPDARSDEAKTAVLIASALAAIAAGGVLRHRNKVHIQVRDGHDAATGG